MFRGVVARIALDLGRGLGPRGPAYPCERTPVSSGDLLDVDQLLDELGERWFIEVELALQGVERDATLLFEVRLRTTNTVQEGHRLRSGSYASSSRSAFASLRSFVSNPSVNQS